MLRSSIPLLAATMLAACAVGPDYERPEVAVSDEWKERTDPGPVDAQWWENFDDPALTELVARMVSNSPNLAESRARVAEARALRQAAQGGRLPQGGATASASENRMSENGLFPVENIPGLPVEYSLFDVGFDASWEIDMWGGATRAVQSAAASEEAAQWALRDVHLSLVAELARTYIEFRAAQNVAEIAHAEAEAADEVAQLSGLLFEAGETDRTDADRAQSRADRAQAGLGQAQANADSARYRIALLVGEQPGELTQLLEESKNDMPVIPDVIAAGVRSDLLNRRPDVRLAERQLAAATANVGVATAELFPSFTLTGGVGFQARETSELDDGGSLRYSYGPGFRWPLFSLGRISAQVRAADARADAAAARYEAAILSALSESEDAANRYAAADLTAKATADALAREQAAFGLAELREERGEDSRLELSQARLSLAQAQRADIHSRLAHGAAAIGFYKALGGGWGGDAEVAALEGE